MSSEDDAVATLLREHRQLLDLAVEIVEKYDNIDWMMQDSAGTDEAIGRLRAFLWEKTS